MASFDKLTVIAPSMDSDIDTAMYGYQAANIIHGYLDSQLKEPQVRIISGYMGSVAVAEAQSHAKRSVGVIASILENDFRVAPEAIVRCDDADLSACILKGGEGSPTFHAGLSGSRRVMGLVGDQESISHALEALEEQNITGREFEVRHPQFAKRSPEEMSAYSTVHVLSVGYPERVRLTTGDE